MKNHEENKEGTAELVARFRLMYDFTYKYLGPYKDYRSLPTMPYVPKEKTGLIDRETAKMFESLTSLRRWITSNIDEVLDRDNPKMFTAHIVAKDGVTKFYELPMIELLNYVKLKHYKNLLREKM